MTQKLIARMEGYKATDKDMKCRGYQYKLGEIHELDNDKPLIQCENGFHFCQQPSGVWAYYNDPSTRVFKVIGYDVLDVPFEAGADFKRVCRKIEFIEEIKIIGHRNTGHRNTGDGNTGDGNTGDGNTGHRNTGDWNTGDGNTGDGNTGDGNTGDWNLCDYSSGYLCINDGPVMIFDLPTDTKRSALPFGLIRELYDKAVSGEPFDYKPFLEIPNATKERIDAYCEKLKKLKGGE